MSQEGKSKLTTFIQEYLFLMMGIITIFFGVFTPDWSSVWTDLITIVRSTGVLTHDYFAVAGIAATFVNVGLHFLVAHIVMKLVGIESIKGAHLASVIFYAGHAFFGSHVLNMLVPMMGVFLYSLVHREPLKNNYTLAIFSNTLSPMVSFIWVLGNFSIYSIIMGIIVGLFAGFISVPLARRTGSFHGGMTLLNYGLVAGLLGIIYSAVMSRLGFVVEPVSIISTQAHLYILRYLILILIILGIYIIVHFQEAFAKYRQLITIKGIAGIDFIQDFGMPAVALNMFNNIALALMIVLALGFQMNGTTLGAILSLLAFSAAGAHTRNIIPPIIGAMLAGLAFGINLDSNGVILPMLFTFGLSPITSNYGFIGGLIAGFMHVTFIGKALALHAGSILYNNGFSTGFLAILLVPILDTFNLRVEHQD